MLVVYAVLSLPPPLQHTYTHCPLRSWDLALICIQSKGQNGSLTNVHTMRLVYCNALPTTFPRNGAFLLQ